MSDSRGWLRKTWKLVGLACVVASFLLSSIGVRIVKAEDPDPASLISVDPSLVRPADPMPAAPAAVAPPSNPLVAPPPSPKPVARDPKALERAGVPSVEVAPGVVVLNTRGYNYGPPPTEIDPEAAKRESTTD